MFDPACIGLLCIGDPHLASRAPGFRKDDYPRTILGKLRWALDYAAQEHLVPIILGDLFHFPRDNANWLIVQVLELLSRPVLAVAGNHDCNADSLTDDDTLSVLCAAGHVHLLDRSGPWRQTINDTLICIGGTCWGRPLPERFDRGDAQLVFWIAHHDVRFPGYEELGRIGCGEVPGVDVVINGHIHRPMEDVRSGTTLWLNPGNIRVRRDDNTRQHVPAALRIDISAGKWARRMVEIPHLPFDQVFHSDLVPADVRVDDSLFIRGLAQLESRKTAGGAGLRAFLEENVKQFPEPVAAEVLALAKEVTDGDSERAKTAQDIEQLRKRHTDLDRRKAAAEANLKTANEQLEVLRKQAREQYGTDDLEQLRGQLDAMKKENERKRQEYQQHLDQIESNLAEVERQHQAARSGERT